MPAITRGEGAIWTAVERIALAKNAVQEPEAPYAFTNRILGHFFCYTGSLLKRRLFRRAPRKSRPKWLFVAGRLRFRRHKLRQAEFLVRELGGAIGVLPINHDGDLDFGGRNQLNVDSALAQAIEQPRGHPGVRPHPDPNHAQLGDSALGDQSRGLNFLYHRRK